MSHVSSSQLSASERIAQRTAEVAYGQPLVTNVLRGLLVETIVAEQLEPHWSWCSSDYASWDFEHPDATRLEVKQSAARQSWATPTSRPSACSFDIKARTGRWENARWVEEPGRSAHIYVFAHHPIEDDRADHRDPEQWRFYVVATTALPSTQRITLRQVQALAAPHGAQTLAGGVERLRTARLEPPNVSNTPWEAGDHMKTLREEQRGKALLRLVQTKDGYGGLVIEGERRGAPILGEDPDHVWAELEAAAGATSASYFGYDGARARFLSCYSGGFADPAFIAEERDYKIVARDLLQAGLPLERARQAGPGDLVTVSRAYGKTNLLSPFERARMGDVLKGGSGPAFVQAAAAFADGEIVSGLNAMRAIIKPHGAASWPMMTYLPFFWRPELHMFLKPRVTVDYAERVGHPFAHLYGSGRPDEVYASLLDLTQTSSDALAELKPQDRIDVQSYIWVIGAWRAPAQAPP